MQRREPLGVGLGQALERVEAEHPHLAHDFSAQRKLSLAAAMLQDVLRNAPTEIDAICGAVVKVGEKYNIETPINWACWKLIKALTQSVVP